MWVRESEDGGEHLVGDNPNVDVEEVLQIGVVDILQDGGPA